MRTEKKRADAATSTLKDLTIHRSKNTLKLYQSHEGFVKYNESLVENK